MPSLFITGGTGFIGASLLRSIDATQFDTIYCLTRKSNTPSNLHAQMIQGDVCVPDSYEPYLSGCNTVLHMAAVTGKAERKRYFEVNASGTEQLIEACRRNGVKNFLYVSTIAVKYAEKTKYYYAESKGQGERAVQNSGLKYVIARPTIVIGKDAPAWAAFSKLARKPVLLVPGNGASRIQPIYIEDLTKCLFSILYDNTYENEIVELGGPEIITIRELLKKIHRLYRHKEPVILPVPLKPVVLLLSAVESVLPSFAPVSVGQLSAFRNDAIIDTNRVFERHVSGMKNVDSMLREVASSGDQAC